MSDAPRGFHLKDENAKEEKAPAKKTTKRQDAKAGHQVLFVLDDSHHPGDVRPALVVAPSDEHDLEDPNKSEDQKEEEEKLSRLDLQVFANGPKDHAENHPHFGAHVRHGVRYDEKKTPNSWHWPEK